MINDKKNIYLRIMLIVFLTCIPTCLFIPTNINRGNILLVPIIFFLAYGVILLYRNYRKLFYVSITLFLVSFSLYQIYYFTEYNNDLKEYTYEGMGEAIRYAEEKGYNKLHMSEAINQPYIFYL